jgi:cytochrome c peroxidase
VRPERAALGATLFADPRFSADGSVACKTCHPPQRAGVDGLPRSKGVGGKEMGVNTPTVFNVTYNFRFNWNGAYKTIEDQLDSPLTRTMATTWQVVEDKIRADPALAKGFAAAYADGVTTANVRDALARYIDTLITPNARIDQFLRGDTDALSALERHGYERFKDVGCASCHQGANVGGNLFQRIGVMADYFLVRGGPPPTGAELGRFSVTGDPADRHVFRVPSLRNVALTGPYFHDGSTSTLDEAVVIMARVQLGRSLDQEDVRAIVAFLGTLTGEPRGVAP